MKIKDVERITGLTQKAIRLYEARGLIQVARDENGYRNFSDKDLAVLKKIKLLRAAGVPITDIRLYLFGISTIDEIVDKRKKEILNENGRTSSQYLFCDGICEMIAGGKDIKDGFFKENEEFCGEDYGELSVGIDIGTTTISAVVFDIENNKQLEAFSLPHSSYICEDIYSEQSVSVIMDKAERLLCHIFEGYKGIVSIGVTGQMHGIVYIDADGNPISNLINWQDKRADLPLPNGKSVCDLIKEITGEGISTGYGIATHYYNMLNGTVPSGAVGFCSIMDLLVMKACGLKKAIAHSSVAAGFGLFDVKAGQFMKEKLSRLGICEDFLPSVTEKSVTVGEYNGIPVSVAIGDNQASVLGSVKENAPSILVNIGTGSQISAVSEYTEVSDGIEIRPFIEGKYLICGSALCGGFAYSMLENFFRSYAVSAGMEETAQYKTINLLAAKAYESGDRGLEVDVSFCGKRSDPNCSGSIKMINRQNFTPSALVIGVLRGMCDELYELYGTFRQKRSVIVASGGSIRKNAVLKKLIAERFGAQVFVNAVNEEAATGAALFSALCVGKAKYENGFSSYIKYQQGDSDESVKD